jgi:hypothetical protein
MSDIRKERVIQKYKTELEQMMTDLDFKRYFGVDVPILKYSELEGYEDINELLPNDKDFKIILTESEYNSGHWCCITKYGNNIEWYDSYAEHPDGQLSFIPQSIKKMLGQNHHHLTRLLKTVKPDQKIIFNNKPFQVLQDGVNTCGRHVICRILCMRFGYTLPEYQQLLKRKKKETGKPYDILIVDWIK